MANFLAELKRRHIYRVAAGYAVLAWLLLQLVNNVAPVLDLPPWVARAFLLLLVIGFPVAIFFAWMRELAPADGSIARAVTSKLDWVLIGALVIVIALLSYQQFAPAPRTTTAQQPASVAGAAPNAAGGISIAVLPFVNLSSDQEQEFFSDGMTEEITAALAKIADLRVVARTSAFQFKGKNQDMPAIARALRATHLIEGSARKAGTRVRVTAQLIKADDGTHLWSENYDRELTDVFAIQEDISQAIAGALRVPLGLKQGESLVANRTTDTTSYQDYLRARALLRLRGLASLTDAAKLFEQVVARDPGYAPAWSLLALTYDIMPNYHPALLSGSVVETRAIVNVSVPRAQAAAQRAILLDPKDADGYEALAVAQAQRGKLLAAEELYLKALALDPNRPDTLHQYSQLLAEVGRLDEALAMRQRLQAVEPLIPVYNTVTALSLWLKSQDEAALGILRDLPADFYLGKIFFAQAQASLGRYGEAATTLSGITAESFFPGTRDEAIRLLRNAPKVAPAPQSLPRLGFLEFVDLHVAASNRILEFQEGEIEAGYTVPVTIALLWHPSYAAVRKTERFKTLMRNAGLVEYWRAKGWPQFCHPTTGDDFACE